MLRLAHIALQEANGAALSPPEGMDLLSQVEQVMITERAQEVDRVSVSLISGAPAGTAVEAGGLQWLRARRLIVLSYADSTGSIVDAARRVFRITDVRRPVHGGPITLEGRHIVEDLDRSIPAYRLPSGAVMVRLSLTGKTLLSALQTLLSSAWGAPAGFVLGQTDPALNGKIVALSLSGETSHLAALQALADQVEAEIEWRYDFALNAWCLDLRKERGWTVAERLAGVPDPNLRPVRLGRRTLNRRSEAGQFFSRVLVLGGYEQDQVTLGEVLWDAESASFNGTHTLVTSTVLLTRTSHALGLFLWPEGASSGFQVVGVEPGLLKLAGNVVSSLTSRFRLAADSTGTQMLEVRDHAGEQLGGRATRPLRLDIPPYANLLKEEGVSADLSDWHSFMPVGWQAVGSASIAQVTGATDQENIQHGTQGAFVFCTEEGDGIQTVPIPLSPTTQRPWHSAAVHLRVLHGRVSVYLLDEDGVLHPKGQVATSNDQSRVVEITLEGFDASAGIARLQLLGSDGAEFILDAATLTNSAGAYRYEPEMGPHALFRAAVELLEQEGGVLPDEFDGETLDESGLTTGLAPIHVGAHVRVQDAWNPSTQSYDVDLTARVVEVSYVEHPLTGSTQKMFKLSRLRSAFRSLFNPAFRRSPLPWRVPQEDRGVVQVTANQVQITGDTVSFRVSARATKPLSYILVQRPSVGSTLEYPVETAYENTLVVNRPVSGPGWVEFEAQVLGVPLSETIRIALPQKAPTLTVGKAVDDSGAERVVTYSISITPAPFSGQVLAASVVEGPPSTTQVEGRPVEVLLSQDSSLTYIYSTVLFQEMAVEFQLLDGTRLERSLIS